MTTTAPTSVASRRSLDTTIVRVLTAVVGLHVVDDNFLHPNAGTSAATTCWVVSCPWRCSSSRRSRIRVFDRSPAA